jgi:hypothetical protein
MLPTIQNLSTKPKTIIFFFFFFLSLGYSTACCNEGNFFGRFSFLGISFHFLGGKKKKTSSSFFNHTREGTQLSFLLGGKEKKKKKIFG